MLLLFSRKHSPLTKQMVREGEWKGCFFSFVLGRGGEKGEGKNFEGKQRENLQGGERRIGKILLSNNQKRKKK